MHTTHSSKIPEFLWRVLSSSAPFSELRIEWGECREEWSSSRSYLDQAYVALLALLFQEQTVYLCPEIGAHGLPKEGVDPVELAQLGSLWMLVGLGQGDLALQRAGLVLAQWNLYLLDHQGEPHMSVWARSHHDLEAYRAWVDVVCAIAYHISSARLFLRKKGTDTPFPQLLLLRMLTPPLGMIPLSPTQVQGRSVGMMKWPMHHASLMISLSGYNSGLLSLHRDDVRIVNVVPQLGGQESGIDRTWGDAEDPFCDVAWETTPYHCLIRGWTKVSGSPLWIHVVGEGTQSQMRLIVTPQEKNPSIPLMMAIYVHASQVVVGGRYVLGSGSDERYAGPCMPIELQGADEGIVLDLAGARSMEVIPLSRNEVGWGGNLAVMISLCTEMSTPFCLHAALPARETLY